MLNPQERRHYTRADIKLPVVLIAGDGLVDGEIQDISLGGAFIRCSAMPNPKDNFHMVISAKGRLISIIAEVVWSDGNKFKSKNALGGIGVRFKRLFHGDRRFLVNLVAEASTTLSVARLAMKIKAHCEVKFSQSSGQDFFPRFSCQIRVHKQMFRIGHRTISYLARRPNLTILQNDQKVI
jgi:hypothetical protein